MKSRWPILTLAIAVAAILVHALPGNVATALQFDRDAFTVGQWWRLLTGHITHFGANHLAWDVAVLMVLGFSSERVSRRRMILALANASVAIPLAIWFWQPQFLTYRGLSGLDSALFGMFATSLIRHTSRLPKVVGMIALIGFGAKCTAEIATGTTVFASGVGYAPVPLAHLVGLVSGVAAMAIPRASLQQFKKSHSRLAPGTPSSARLLT
jgi:rhomboid family GlyGly-CTERM serine protease